MDGDNLMEFFNGADGGYNPEDTYIAYYYPRAGDNAPFEVQKAIDEFRQLPEEEVQNRPLLYWILGSGTPDYKMTKRDSHYSTAGSAQEELIPGQTDIQKCGNCRFAFQRVISGQYICSQISGGISPEAWCKLWKQ